VGDEVDGAWEAAGEERVVVVCVSDTGSGVPLEIVESVFDPLVTRKQRGGERPGTGLGLAICRRVVHGAGGRLWIWSQPSVGTAVVAVLPAE
jgi:signal transduction histidine kinase